MVEFYTEKVTWADIEAKLGKKAECAYIGSLRPRGIAQTVLGKHLEAGNLFLYLFRRFGMSVELCDGYKSACVYHLTTPKPDVFLTAIITVTDQTDLLFGYCISRELAGKLAWEDEAHTDAWHRECDVWAANQGIARDDPEHVDRYIAANPGAESRLFDYDGPVKNGIVAALKVTLQDLLRPTYIRDVYFNCLGRVDDAALSVLLPAAEYHEPSPEPVIARSIEDYHEDYGDVLWWRFPVMEAPYVGSTLDCGWPGYHTHWTPLPPVPQEPVSPEGMR